MRALLVPALALSLLAAAQSTAPVPGTFTGIVLDAAGAALPGATIEVLFDGRVQMTVTADARGAFTLTGLPPASYQMRVVLAGFKTFSGTIVIGRSASRSLRIVLTANGSVASPMAIAQDGLMPGASTESYKNVAPAPARMIAGQATAFGNAARFSAESYARVDEGGFRHVADHPLSTFSIDVDTASYSNIAALPR